MKRALLRHLGQIGLGLGGGLIASGLMLRIADPPALPIAILDRGALLETLDKNENLSDQKALKIRFDAIAKQLADAGYLVIDRGWVIAAPEEFYVDSSLDPPR